MSRQPWEGVGAFKDEKAFLNWLRSQTRRIWMRHPTKIAYIQSRRYKAPVGVNGREVWVNDCEICGKQSRGCEVDHIKAGGSFSNWEEYTEWAKRILWVGLDDIRLLCKECHQTVTTKQRLGISFEEAQMEQKVIAFRKLKASKQREELEKLGIRPEGNAAKRVEQYCKYIKGNK